MWNLFYTYLDFSQQPREDILVIWLELHHFYLTFVANGWLVRQSNLCNDDVIRLLMMIFA